MGEHGPQWKQAVLRAYTEGFIIGEHAGELLGGRITADELLESQGRTARLTEVLGGLVADSDTVVTDEMLFGLLDAGRR